MAQSCIYGVDLNPLAVDLAKLSLWLITAAADKPLSFLDHHLRAGNALVGTRLDDLATGAGQQRAKRSATAAAPELRLIDDAALQRAMGTAVASMWIIEGKQNNSIADVREQERIYEAVRRDLTERFGRAADLITATYFGLKVDQTFWRPLINAVIGAADVPPLFRPWSDEAEALTARHRFFHWELEFPEVFFDRWGNPRADGGGFDVVIGNPPYVRQELLAPLKPWLAHAFPQVYQGTADLYVYFIRQALGLTRPGGRMAYIVTNKWLRAGYGEPLRGYLAEQHALAELVDFGHAPIFPEADVFPCIMLLARPALDDDGVPPTEARVATIPREQLGSAQQMQTHDLARSVREHGHRVPLARFGRGAWNLEPGNVEDLMAKIRAAGVPLAEYAGVTPYRGILTGLNEAFLIDTPTKERLIAADPHCAAIIKPYLRGQDIRRWSPEWADLWMILLKSSGDHPWPWAAAGDAAESVFQQTYPALHAHMNPLEEKLRKRQDHGRFWWELRSCAYYAAFEQPKLVYQEIQTFPWFALDTSGSYSNNKVFFLPTSDEWLLGLLNSPLMWWHNHRYLPHMINDTITPLGVLMVKLPIAPPTEETRAAVEPAVARLIGITQAQRSARSALLDWLRVEFAIATPGQKLEAFSTLSSDAFVDEVKKRRPRAAGALSAAALARLRGEFAATAPPLHALAAEAVALERLLSDAVNAAYGLTAADVALLWATAPPRMPGGETIHHRDTEGAQRMHRG